jgi:hypothetical protein
MIMIFIHLSASIQLNEAGDFNIDEELQNVPPEIVEEGHRIVKECHGTRMDFYSIYLKTDSLTPMVQ